MPARIFDEVNTATAVDMYLCGNTYQEIADHFGCSRSAVDNLFQRLRDEKYMTKQAIARIQETVYIQVLKNLQNTSKIPLHNMTVLKFIKDLGLIPDLDESAALDKLKEIANSYEDSE